MLASETPQVSGSCHSRPAYTEASRPATFVMLEFPLGNRATPEPSVIYSESWTGALYLDRLEEFAAYEKVWAGLDQLALDERQSQAPDQQDHRGGPPWLL